MKARIGNFGIAAAVALVAAAGIHAARAGDISIMGKWEVVKAEPAPWSPPELKDELTRIGKGLLNLEVTFKPGTVISKYKLFNCKRKVLYEPVDLPVDTLFQGNLPEPNPAAAARRMGFSGGDVPSVDVRCLNAKFTFHFRDKDTAMINLNRVIYTFKRQ